MTVEKAEGIEIYHSGPDYQLAKSTSLRRGFILDLNGTVLHTFEGFCVVQWSYEKPVFVNGLSRIWNIFNNSDDKQEYYFIDETFRVLHEKPFEWINYQWFGQYIRVSEKKLDGYLNNKLEWVIPPVLKIKDGDDDKYNLPFIEIEYAGKHGILDSELFPLVPPVYDQVLVMENEEFSVNKGPREYGIVAVVMSETGKYGVYWISLNSKGWERVLVSFTGCIYDDFNPNQRSLYLDFSVYAGGKEVVLYGGAGENAIETTPEGEEIVYPLILIIEQIRFEGGVLA